MCVKYTHKEFHLVTLAERLTYNLITSTATREMLVSLASRLALSELSIWIPPPQKWTNFPERCAMCWSEWKINFPIFISQVIVDFVDNFPVFLPTTNVKKRCTMFWNGFPSSRVFYAIFSFWDMDDFVFDIHSLETQCHLNQKYKPMVLDNQLATEIKFKSIEGLRVEPPVGDVGR